MTRFWCRQTNAKRFRRVIVSIVAAGTTLVAAPLAMAQDEGDADVSIGYLNVMGTMHGTSVQITIRASTRGRAAFEGHRRSLLHLQTLRD